jgi:hypothetical protein
MLNVTIAEPGLLREKGTVWVKEAFIRTANAPCCAWE